MKKNNYLNKFFNIFLKKSSLILFICLMISLLIIYSVYSQGQERYTVFKTDNASFKFLIKGNKPVLHIGDNPDKFFSVSGFKYKSIGGGYTNYNPRCPCNTDNYQLRDCPESFISNFDLGNECYNEYHDQIRGDQRSEKFIKDNSGEGRYFSQLRIDQGILNILGDLKVEDNKNSDCTWLPSANSYYDINVRNGELISTCPEGYFMKGIGFRGSDEFSLDMWKILCCKL